MGNDLNKSARTALAAALAATVGLALVPRPASADENGVSFWLPGIYGTLAAVPTPPGFSFTTFNYYDTVSTERTIDLGGGEHVVAGVNANANLQYVFPSYAFNTPLGSLSVGMFGFAGSNTTSASETFVGPTGPSVTTGSSATLFSYGDLAPVVTLKWGYPGPNYFMTYLAGAIPVGSYAAGRLNVFGIGHGAIDGGAGYSYFDNDGVNGVSAVAGVTYNFINPSTQYQNGIDAHLDLSAVRFLVPKFFFVGAVGYVYDQLTGDSGSSATLGSFRSRVLGVGPQLGFVFPVGGMLGYLTFKGYAEFDAQNRASGYNLWTTFSLTPMPPASAPALVVAKY
jgi:hypothetical protein